MPLPNGFRIVVHKAGGVTMYLEVKCLCPSSRTIKRGKLSLESNRVRLRFDSLDEDSVYTFPATSLAVDRSLPDWIGKFDKLILTLKRLEDLTIQSEKNITESSCSCCGKMNDNGIKTCWWCGNEP